MSQVVNHLLFHKAMVGVDIDRVDQYIEIADGASSAAEVSTIEDNKSPKNVDAIDKKDIQKNIFKGSFRSSILSLYPIDNIKTNRNDWIIENEDKTVIFDNM